MKRSAIIMLHVGYWLLYLVFLTVLALLVNNRPSWLLGWGMVKFAIAVAVIPALISFYVAYSYLFPEFLNKKRILFLVSAGITVACVASLVGVIVLPFLYGPNPDPSGPEIMRGDGYYTVPGDMGKTILIPLNALINCIIGLVVKVFTNWYEDIKLKEDLNQKNYEIEMALVKSQLNPHFLFNTINNIDVLIEKDAVQASLYLNKLSDIMRFMLYETKTEETTLVKELAYIEKYIDLQKIRTTNASYVTFSVNGDPGNRVIAPMLFIPFIENAFKHAENKKKDNAIAIRINIEQDRIRFDCENNYSELVQVRPEQSGLGNDLIRRRLQLLYPGNHVLDVTDENRTYSVQLTVLNHEN